VLLEDVSLAPLESLAPLLEPEPELVLLLWCFELFFECFFDVEELAPVVSSLVEPERPVAVPLDVSDEPVEPLMPPVEPVEPIEPEEPDAPDESDEPEEPIEPPEPEVVSLGLVEPLDDGELAPAPVPLDVDGLEVELEDEGLEEDEDDDGLEDELELELLSLEEDGLELELEDGLDVELDPVPLEDVSLEPDEPVPDVDGLEVELEDDGLDEDEDDDGLEDELELLSLDEDELELWSLDDPEPLDDAPDELMSIIFAVSPENDARTCAPSWMSERLACEPSFVTFVLWSTLSCLSLPESESVLSF
jgi:hypothetical protein